MSVQSESVVELFGKLCDLHLGETKRSHLVQPKVERDVHFHHLRRKAFDTLFNFLKSPQSKQSGVGVGGVKVEVDSVLQKVYELRVARCFQDADRLEHLLEHYLAQTSEADRGALKFLAGLAGTGTPLPSLPLGHGTYHTPVVSEDTNKDLHLPSGPLCYGDSHQSLTQGGASLGTYMHFPPHLFNTDLRHHHAAVERGAHTPSERDVSPAAKTSSIFTLSPGAGMASSSIFSTEKESVDQHEHLTRLSLFGGLVRARVTTMTVKLDLPDLPDDPLICPPETSIPKALSMSELSEDEGFITTEGSSSATTPADSFAEEDIWELALTTTPCRNYVWERIGCEPVTTERPYLTEAGPQALDELCRLRRHHEQLLDPSLSSVCLRQLSPAQLVKDVAYLLIGIPSRTFPYVETEKKFAIDPAISTSGLSPEALHSLLGGFVVCGTRYQRLTEFSGASQQQQQLGSRYTKGLVLQAFKGGVRAVLQHYRAAVLSLPPDLSLMALNRHCAKAVRQIGFLAELCQCVDDAPGQPSATSFPLGVALISYLYQETVNAINTDYYLMMLSLLRTTCQPFVLFMQDWVFHGTFRDVYGEFMIQVNQKFLEARDESYWEKGYTLTTEDESASVPTFLTHLAPAIFRCGKALNLLRMCCPQHFLCGLSDNEIPRVSISYSRSDLNDINVQCQMYVSRMRQMARQLTVTRAEQQRRAEESQRELLETARRMASMEIARLQGILDGHKQRQDAKKRKEFQRLKEQMTADLQRRAGEEAEARREDQQYMAALTRQEEALTQQDIELEKQARDELIAYYAELGEEAARRERRALWRIRRARLETERNGLLAAEEERWKVELAEHRHAQGLLDRGSEGDSLPDWAQNPDTLQVGGTERWDGVTDTETQSRDWSLPKWAERNLPPASSDDQPTNKPPPPEHGLGVSTSEEDEGQGQSIGDEESVSAASPRVGESSTMTLKSEGTTESGVRDSSSPSTTLKSEEAAVEGDSVDVDLSGEDRMPAWARRVLHQGTDSSVDTVVVTDGNNDDGVADDTNPRPSGSSRAEASIVTDPAGFSHSADSVATDPQNPALSDSQDSDPLATAPVSESEITVVVVVAGEGGEGEEEGGDSDLVAETPRSARRKTSIRMVGGASTCQQTEQPASKPHIQILENVQASTESSGVEDTCRHVKMVPGMSATMETEAEDLPKLTIILSQTMHATKESQQQEQRPHLKVVADRNANMESSEEVKPIPKLAGSSQYNISTESSATEWRVKKASLFGHVSQLSKQEYAFQAPRLKRHRNLHASLESEFREFAVKPRIRMHKQRTATAESEEQVNRPMIRAFKDRHANMESEYVDVDGIRRKRFLEQNVFGHSSDSTVQRLLYGGGFGSEAPQKTEDIADLQELVPPFDLQSLDMMEDDLEKFQDNFDHLNDGPMVDLLASMPGVVHGSMGAALWQREVTQEEAEVIALTPLPVLLQQALTAPLMAQISLVDEVVVNYFLVGLKVEAHFEALHRYLFMADGDFAQNLTDILLEKLSTCNLPQEMLTPVFLNAALTRALQLSASVRQQHADSLSFALRYMPQFFKHHAHDTLDCLELRYKVEWPLNVVITESSQACYGQVFSFMLQLKRVAWTLNDCWYRLKRDALVKKAKDSCQFRQIQLHRQEMQHFVKVMQAYMANQIIQVTWKELQEALEHQVKSLDDLRQVHHHYLHKALFRCLLNKKAAPIMKIIRDIFCLILKFCAQLASATWEQGAASGEVTHPNFAAMVTSYKAFKEYFVFLFKVVNKLAVRGYQPHLHELLLRLNFNDYYTTR